jgi:predicted nucleic acid-binding protein
MRIIINDTSCLIDLRKAGLLSTTLLLPYAFVVALPLVASELLGFTQGDWEDLRARGLENLDLSGPQVEAALEIRRRYPGLSANDCFSLVLAQAGDDRILLTGDAQLRRRAADAGVEVHGVLWVADQLAERDLMLQADLADALERLAADPVVFLPIDEVRARVARWRRTRS